MTIHQTYSVSNNHNKLAVTNRNFLTSITSFFEEAAIRFSSIFKGNKNALKASETLYLNSNSGIINLRKLISRKATTNKVKTIEEFDLAGCFDKSEIIAAAVSRNKYLWSYHDNPTKEESRYDREEEDYEERHNQRQSSQLRGN